MFTSFYIFRSSYSLRRLDPSLSKRHVEASLVSQLHDTHHLLPHSLPSLATTTSIALPHSTSSVLHKASPSTLLTFGSPSASTARVGSIGTHTKPVLDLSDTSGKFLAETRATFARLEKEAEELDKTYQSFHQKSSVGSPQLREDESLLPLHHTPLARHESMSTHPTFINFLQPQNAAAIPTTTSSQINSVFTSSSVTTATHTTAQTLTSTQNPMQPNSTRSLSSTTHPPSTLTTVVATAPPALTATTTPPMDVVAVSPPSPTTVVGAKPTLTVSQQQLSTEESSTKTRQRLSSDNLWKKSSSLPPSSSISSKQPPADSQGVSLSPGGSSKPVGEDDRIKLSHSFEKPKIKLDDLWKNPAMMVGVAPHSVQRESAKAGNSSFPDGQHSQSPAPVKVEKPKLSLDDLWKNPSPPSRSQAPVTPAEPTMAMNKRVKEEREDKEKLRKERELQEKERVRKELEELERQEKLRQVESSNRQKQLDISEQHSYEIDDKHPKTDITSGQNASAVVTDKERDESESEEEKKAVSSESDGIDPVMIKYMQLVKEKRQKQQV